MPTRLLSVTPRIAGDQHGITARSSRVGQFLMLGVAGRRVRVDYADRTIRLDERRWWFARSSRLVLFDEVAAVSYGYEEWSVFGPLFARDPMDRFVVGLKLKWGEEVRLFNFVGDGTFTNDGPMPDWVYWKEFAFDMSGTQEGESRMFARVLAKILGVAVEPSGLVAD